MVPVRAEASEAAEQLTQLLFAETVEILEEKPRWIHVHNDADGQEGWVDSKMLTKLNADEEKAISQTNRIARVGAPVIFAVSENNSQTIPLTVGTTLPDYQDGHFNVLGVSFRIDPNMVVAEPLEMNTENLMYATRFLLNTPYQWGGKNALGMDCSGFTQVVHSLFGHSLLRNASEQATEGQAVESLAKAQAGDLAFFDHEDGRISHVGIVLDKARIIHCSGRVKVEKLDEKGIYSAEQGGVYTHHLVSIRRY